MTPQDKAKELVEKFRVHAKNWDCYHDVPLDENHTKECAKIAVNEIIAELEPFDSFGSRYAYWHSVLECLKNY